jgi:hypothetical protein
MALTIGQLLSGAGTIAGAQLEAEEARRVARENQLKIQQQNRLETLRRMPRPDIAATPAAADFSQYQFGVREIEPPIAAPAAAPTPAVAPAPTPAPAPAAPATAPAVVSPFEDIYSRLKGNQANIQAAGRGMSAQELLSVYALSLRKGDVDTASRIEPFLLVTHKVPQQELASIKRQLAGIRREDQDVSPLLQALGFGRKAAAERQAKELARLQEIRTGEKPIPTAVPAAVPAAAPTTGATKAAQDYDKKVTPYDALIQQSAAQYGLNPVIFRRLLGTESSFDPNKVSPRGESFGLGIAQIADVHGLTREQKLDPNVAIPFAAQLFADYLAGNDGDYVKALEQYKGASTEAGRTAMAKPIRDILSGVMEAVVPEAEAAPAAGVAPTIPTAPAATKQLKPSDFYLGNPQAVNRDMQVALQNREELRRMALMYRSAGLTEQYDALRQQIMQLDQGLFYLTGMQSIQQLMSYRDPRMLSAVISESTGVPTGVIPRTDNLYDIVANPGTPNESIISQGVPAEQIAAYAQELFDPSLRAARVERAEFAAREEIKGRAGAQQAMIKAVADIQTAIINGEYKKAEKLAEQAKGELKFDTASGRWAFVKGNDVRIIDPSEQTVVETPLGPITRPPTARKITGLNFGQ